jgi:hypothetical protein
MTFSHICILRGDLTSILNIIFLTFGLLGGEKGTTSIVNNSPRGLLLIVHKLALLKHSLEHVEPSFVCFIVEMLAIKIHIHMHKRLIEKLLDRKPYILF